MYVPRPSLPCQFPLNYVSTGSMMVVQLQHAEVTDKDIQISSNSWDSSFKGLKTTSLTTKYHAKRPSKERERALP